MIPLRWSIALVVITASVLSNGLLAQVPERDTHPGKFYTIEKRYENSNVDGYNLYVPDSYTSGPKGFPVIVFLQGGLGVGGRVDSIFNWELPKELKKPKQLGSELNELKMNTFIYIMPHISQGQFYEHVDALKQVITDVARKYQIDEQRIYLTGLSRGGHGTWGVASKVPEMFAAVAPICGAAHGIADYGSLAKLPILTAHNYLDESVNYLETSDTVGQIEKLSGKKFSRLKSIAEAGPEKGDLILITGEGDEKGHDAWTEVYNSVHFYKWLLRYKRE